MSITRFERRRMKLGPLKFLSFTEPYETRPANAQEVASLYLESSNQLKPLRNGTPNLSANALVSMILSAHSKVCMAFQGSFSSYYAFPSGCPTGPILTRVWPASVNILLGEPLNISAFASLGRATVARYN
jgi:hypothetical protein